MGAYQKYRRIKKYPQGMNEHDSTTIGTIPFLVMREEITRKFRPQYEANKKIILSTQELCAICGLPVDKRLKSPDPMSATVDHIIPIAKGGHPSDITNLQLAHRSCNRAKGTKIVTDIPKQEIEPNRDLPQTMDWRTS